MRKNDRISLLKDAQNAIHAARDTAQTVVSSATHIASGKRLPETEREPMLYHEEVRYEHSDLNARAVMVAGVVLLLSVWGITGALYAYFAYLSHYRSNVSPPPLAISSTNERIPPEPRLQQSPQDDLRRLRAREDVLLNHYRWIDKQKGIVALPIDRAIKLIAERGIPPQKAPAGVVLSKPEDGTRRTGFEGKVEPEPR